MDTVTSTVRVGTAATTVVGDAVGVSTPDDNRPQWYIAVVNNNSEKLCRDRMEQRIAHQPVDGKDYEVYVPTQKVMREGRNGRRTSVERILFPAYVFVYCTDQMRRNEIVSLPYIKRFFVNAAGKPVNGHRPVATVPDCQMQVLKRMISDAGSPVSIEARSFRLGERVRVNGGKLVGLEGHIYREADGSTSFVVRIDILGCAKVTIDADLLDPVIAP